MVILTRFEPNNESKQSKAWEGTTKEHHQGSRWSEYWLKFHMLNNFTLTTSNIPFIRPTTPPAEGRFYCRHSTLSYRYMLNHSHSNREVTPKI